MARNKDDEASHRSKAIWNALESARKALNRYQHAVLTAADNGRTPESSRQVRQELLTLHTATMNCFIKLRADLKGELDDLWDGGEDQYLVKEDFWYVDLDGERVPYADIPEDARDRFDNDDFSRETEYIGLKLLDEYHSRYEAHRREEYVKQRGRVIRTVTEPRLLTGRLYIEAVNLLGQAAKDLGYAPEPKRKLPKDKISPDNL